jgi:hypothetical protein
MEYYTSRHENLMLQIYHVISGSYVTYTEEPVGMCSSGWPKGKVQPRS